MTDVVETEVACKSCRAETLLIGHSKISAEMISRAPTAAAEWMRIAASQRYDEQTVHCCRECGLVFIEPCLTDEAKRALLLTASGHKVPPQTGWTAVDASTAPSADDEPSVWSYAVRAPSLDASLGQLLTSPVRLLDVGALRGEPTAHLHLPRGSKVDLLQAEPSSLVTIPYAARRRSGFLADLRGSGEQWDVVLALDVLQQVEMPSIFLNDLVAMLTSDGILVVEVPFEVQDVWPIATAETFSVTHNSFFAPWSLRQLLADQPLEIIEFDYLDLFHTGVGDVPFPVIRILAQKRESAVSSRTHSPNSFVETVNHITRSLAGSIAYAGGKNFRVFVYGEEQRLLANLFRRAPGFRGLTTSNSSLDVPSVFDPRTLENIDYVITLHPSHRSDLRVSLPWNWMVI